MSLFKHFGEQGSQFHGGHLFWSGAMNGLPFRGNHAPTLTKSELETKVEVAWDFYWQEFDLSKEDDGKKFQYVMDRAVNGWFYIHHIERYREDGKRMVYVEWSQRYGQLAPSSGDAQRSYGNELAPSATIPVDHPQRLPLAGQQDPAHY